MNTIQQPLSLSIKVFNFVKALASYGIAIFLGWFLTWAIKGMWFDDTYSTPYASVFLIGAIAIIVMAVIHNDLLLESSKFIVKLLPGVSPNGLEEAYGTLCRVIFWLYVALTLTIGTVGFWRTHASVSENTYWTLSDGDGNISQDTDYPEWTFGYHAYNPITLKELPSYSDYGQTGEPIGYLFRWNGTVTDTVLLGDVCCYIQIDYSYTSPVTHTNVMSQVEYPINDKLITQKIFDLYVPKVRTNAKQNKGNCTLDRVVEVDTRFDANNISPTLHFNTATFTCKYWYKPIV